MAKQITDENLNVNMKINGGNEAKKKLGDLENSYSTLKNKNEDLRKAKQALIAAGDKESDAYKKIETELKKNNVALSQNKDQQKLMRKEVGLTGMTMGQLEKEQKRLYASIKNGATAGTAEHAKLKNEYKEVNAELKKQKGELNGTKNAMDDNAQGANALTASFNDIFTGLAAGNFAQVKAGFMGLKASIIGATKASLAFIATPLGAVLAAIALAVAAVTQYFRDNEEGQDAWNKITAVTGVIVGNLTDMLSALGGMLFKVFTEPKQVWEDFVNSLQSGYKFIKGQVYDRLIAETNLMVGNFQKKVLQMRIAWNKWTGDSKEAEQLTKELDKVNQKIDESTKLINEKNQEIKDFATGVVNGVKAIGQEMADETKRMAELSDQAAKADKIERALIVERSKVEAKVAEARFKAREEEKYSAAERKQFLSDAVELETGLINKEIEAAKIRAEIKTAQNKFSNSNKDDLNEEAELIAKIGNLERKRADAARALKRDQLRVDGQLKKETGGSSADKEADAEIKKINEKEEQLLAVIREKQRQRELDKMEGVARELALIDDKYDKEIAGAEGHADRIADLEIFREEEKNALKLEKKQEYENRILEIENESRLLREEAELEERVAQAETQLEKDELRLEHARNLANDELQMAMDLELAKVEAVENAEELKAAIRENYRLQGEKMNLQFDKQEQDLKKDQVKWTELTEQQKLSAITGALGAAADAFNEGSAAWKAIKISETLIATYQSAQNAYSALAGIPVVGPALGAAAAGLAVVSGLKQVAKIKSTPLAKINPPKKTSVRGHEDGLYRDVTRTDGRRFNARDMGKSGTGIVKEPSYFSNGGGFLAAEAGPEMIIDNDVFNKLDPSFVKHVYDVRHQVKGFASGKYPDQGQGSDPELKAMLAGMMNLLQNPPSPTLVWGYEAVEKNNELQTEIEQSKNNGKLTP